MTNFTDTPLFRTVVDVKALPSGMAPNDGFVFLGSCFAQHIGARFMDYALPSLVNPLGVLYNPFSIGNVVSHALQPDIDPLLFQTPDNRYCCWLAGTQTSGISQEECSVKVKNELSALKCGLTSARFLFITLGTNVVYRHRELGVVVSNCHRMPQSVFSEETMSLDDCTEALSKTVDAVRSINDKIQIIFTVSPYRYAKYGYHGSQLAKSVLLLAADSVCKCYPQCCHYFPSYEIVLDELRDYRFYAEDMLHPSQQAIDYIWHRLVQTCFTPDARQYLKEYEPVRKGLLHRPLQYDKEREAERTEALMAKAREIWGRYGISSGTE